MISPLPMPALELFFGDKVQLFTEELQSLQELAQDREPQRDALLSRLTAAIKQQCSHCSRWEEQLVRPELVRQLQTAFQAAIEPWFSQSWFMLRARTKPRGYPGDYVLLNGIYDRKPKSTGLGGYLDLYFLESDLGRAVPARMEAIRQALNWELAHARGPLRIMNVACGPCREYLSGLEIPPHQSVKIICIDSDQEALRHAESCVSPVLCGQALLDFVNYNALRMRSARRNLERFGPQDFIYSIGLLDYLPDQHLVPILQGLRETLAPGGQLFVAFKDAARYDKAEYQWFVDWFFLQRTAAECRSLLLQAGFQDDEVTMSRDATGIILNFAATVPAESRQLRHDAAHAAAPARTSTVPADLPPVDLLES